MEYICTEILKKINRHILNAHSKYKFNGSLLASGLLCIVFKGKVFRLQDVANLSFGVHYSGYGADEIVDAVSLLRIGDV